MTISITAGTRLYISLSTPTTNDLAGYNSLAYTQMRGVANFSDIGNVYETARVNLMGFVPQEKKVGLAAQTVSLEMYKLTDAGQWLLTQSVKTYAPATFKIITLSGDATYFTAEVSQQLKNLGTVESAAKRTYLLNLTSEVIET